MTSPIEVLFCDDLKSERSAFASRIARRLPPGIHVSTTSSLDGVERRIAAGEVFDVVITDLNFETVGGGSKDGLRIVRAAREAWPQVEVVLFTAYPGFLHPTELLEATDLGLKRETWVQKLSDDPSESWRRLESVLIGLCRVIEERRASREVQGQEVADTVRLAACRPLGPVDVRDRFAEAPELTGKSPAMQDVFEAVRRVSPTPAPVLVTGPTGTGKELVARAIHRLSRRADAPFLAVNCGELGEDLLASELFGHEKGAFTGAVGAKPGLLVEARGGTFFLDEVGEMSTANQAKLLRVLQEKRLRPVGGSRSVEIDVRFLAATNRDLAQGIREGWFRQDLHDRLDIYRIEIPALAERREDVVAAAVHYFDLLAPRYGKAVRAIDEEALWKLVEYDWPENLRQVVNVVTHTLINLPVEADRITADDIDLDATALPSGTGRRARGVPERVLAGQLGLSLPEISSRFGEPTALEVVRRTMLHFRGLPPEEETLRLFGMTYRNWQHWAHYHGLSWRKVRAQA